MVGLALDDHLLDAINVPIHIVQSYQDEQTGPRGSNLLWQRLDERKPSLPKRLILTNGVHSTNTGPPEIRDDRVAFLDCYVRLVCTGDITDPTSRVKVLFETRRVTVDGNSFLASNGVLASSNWPLPETTWTRYYFQPGGGLATTLPAPSGPDMYLAGSKRAGAWLFPSANAGAELTTANLPDEVRFSRTFGTDTAIAGPIAVTLHAASTAPDTEFYVELNDVDDAGNMTRLQRGLLKASHREIDPFQTDYTAAGEIYRPYHPHTNTTTNLLVPGQAYEFQVEVFPLGHIFRAGHTLVVRVTTPPIADSLAFYLPTTGAGVNLVYHDPAHPSSILLPEVRLPSGLGAPVGCGLQAGLERCTKPLN